MHQAPLEKAAAPASMQPLQIKLHKLSMSMPRLAHAAALPWQAKKQAALVWVATP